jgi:hypothetical protein
MRRVKWLKQEAMNPGRNQPGSWLHGFLLNHVWLGWGAAALGISVADAEGGYSVCGL